MPDKRPGRALKDIESLFGGGIVAGKDDDQLLERFASRRDEAAFDALVAAHGPMVLAVCRRVLANPGDVEDAFQATFLVPARKALSTRAGTTLGGWLRRVAVEVNRDAIRRRVREATSAAMSASDHQSYVPDDFRPVLHEEIGRLPEKLRRSVVLCYVEGMTQEDAAAELRWGGAMLRRRPGSGSARGWDAGGSRRRRPARRSRREGLTASIGAGRRQGRIRTHPGKNRHRSPNPDGVLSHGRSGTILYSPVEDNAIVVPRRATLEAAGRRYVYVVAKDGVAPRRVITVRAEVDDLFVVKNGVAVGESIVVDGVKQVLDG